MPNDDDKDTQTDDDKDAQAREDARTLAAAMRIQDDEKRSEAVRELLKKKRKADVFASSDVLKKLKARRQAVEAGDLEGAPKAYNEGVYNE